MIDNKKHFRKRLTELKALSDQALLDLYGKEHTDTDDKAIKHHRDFRTRGSQDRRAKENGADVDGRGSYGRRHPRDLPSLLVLVLAFGYRGTPDSRGSFLALSFRAAALETLRRKGYLRERSLIGFLDYAFFLRDIP